MRNFLRFYFKTVSFSVAQMTVYRTSFWLYYLWLLGDTAIKVLFFGAIFTQVDSIGGWTFTNTFLLVLFNGLLWDFAWTFFLTGFEDFIENFSKGNFDFILLKPMNPLLYLTISGFAARSFSGARLPLLIYAIFFLSIQWQFSSSIAALVIFVAGIMIFHAIFAIVAALSFWIIDPEPILDLAFGITEGSRYPITIFPQAMRFIFTFIIPIFFVANFPVMVIQNLIGQREAVLTALFVAICSQIVAYLVWKVSVRHYSSASS